MAGQEDVKTSTIALIGFLGAVVLFAIIILLEVLYYAAAASQIQEKDVDRPCAELDDARTNQQAKLAGYHWVDRSKGIVAVPIDRAMEITVRDIAAGKLPHGAPAALKETKSAKPE